MGILKIPPTEPLKAAPRLSISQTMEGVVSTGPHGGSRKVTSPRPPASKIPAGRPGTRGWKGQGAGGEPQAAAGRPGAAPRSGGDAAPSARLAPRPEPRPEPRAAGPAEQVGRALGRGRCGA